jgi:hypothetical protein
MRGRGAAILAVLTALAPACGGGGSGGAPLPLVFTPLAPVDTSGATQIVDTSKAPGLITTQLQGFLNAGGIIVFNNGAPMTIALTAELSLPADKTAVIDGNYKGGGRVTLSGSATQPIIVKGDRSNLTVQRLDFVDGRAATEGGAIRGQQDGFVTVIDCQFTDCKTTATLGHDIGGGGIRLINERRLQVSGSTFTNCDGPNGGAIDCIGTQITLINCTFTGCDATGNGGGADVGGDGGIGGAVYVDGVSQHSLERRLDVVGCSFTNNTAGDHAGALFAYTIAGTGSHTLIDQCTFSNNSITDVTPVVGLGGGVYHQSNDLLLTRSTFDGNTSTKHGGGLWSSCKSGTIENCTFWGNKAMGAPGFGGGMSINGTFLINSCTIAENQANWWAGGIYAGDPANAAKVTLRNSLLQNNTGTDPFNGWNVNETLGHGSNNLQWPLGGATNLPARPDIVFLDALLKPLNLNGYTIRTMAIPNTSPAVDRGNLKTAADTDQRGNARVGLPDIGAYEYP